MHGARMGAHGMFAGLLARWPAARGRPGVALRVLRDSVGLMQPCRPASRRAARPLSSRRPGRRQSACR